MIGDLVLQDSDLRLRCAEAARGIEKLLTQGKIRAPIELEGALWIAVETDDGYLLHEVIAGDAEVASTGQIGKGIGAKHVGTGFVFTGQQRIARLPKIGARPAYEIHELCALLPPMAEDEYRDLVADIRANGLRDAITIYEGKILDGRHRDRACRETGQPPRYEVLADGDDPVALVASRQIRRSITASQKAMLAAELIAYRARRPQAHAPRNVAGTSGHSSKAVVEAATEFGVSPRSVDSARKVIANGVPKLAEKVRTNKLPVHVAEEIASAPPEEQREVIELSDAEITRRAREISKRKRADKIAKQQERAKEQAKRAKPVERVEILHGDASLAIKRANELGGARFVLADPPWDQYEERPGKAAVDENYPTLSLDDIATHLDAIEGAHPDGARMLVFHTGPLLAEAIGSVVRDNDSPWAPILCPSQWDGPLSKGSWVKDVAQPGVGKQWLGHAEDALLYTCGTPRPRPTNEMLRSGHVTTERTEHSQKPAEWLRAMLLAWTEPGDLVLELYTGKSALPQICLELGRRYVGAEIHEGRHAEAVIALSPPVPLFEGVAK